MFKSDDMALYMDKLQKTTSLVEHKLGGSVTPEEYQRQSKLASFDEPKNPYRALNRNRGSESVYNKLRALWSPLVNIPEAKIREDDTFFELGELTFPFPVF